MTQCDINNPVRSKNYREVTVFSAKEYYNEIHRAQRGWKEVSFAIMDDGDPYTAKVFKDGKWVATVKVKLS